MAPTKSRNRKIEYGCQAAISKMTLLKINRLLPIYISIVPLKFGVDIQIQSKVRVWKPKNPIWLPGGHFDSDVAENQQASPYGHHQHAYEIWNWNSKANLTYAPETMSSTDRRRTDGRMDGRTNGQGESSIPPPPTSLGRGIINPNKFEKKILTFCYCSWVNEANTPGGGLNIKMSCYQYRDPHVKDKMVSRPSSL